MQTIGDLILLLSVGVALWYVPRYLWRVYGGPPIGALVVNLFGPIASWFSRPHFADETDRRADRLSVSAEIEEPRRPQLDKTREALIEFLLDDGWAITDLRREGILRGDNTKISAEVEAARKRLGIESGVPRTPIAKRSTDARFASDMQR